MSYLLNLYIIFSFFKGSVREWDLEKLGESSPGEREREKERRRREKEEMRAQQKEEQSNHSRREGIIFFTYFSLLS